MTSLTLRHGNDLTRTTELGTRAWPCAKATGTKDSVLGAQVLLWVPNRAHLAFRVQKLWHCLLPPAGPSCVTLGKSFASWNLIGETGMIPAQ